MSLVERRIQMAILLMKRGSPLPLDLEVYLLSEGIDVAGLDETFRD